MVREQLHEGVQYACYQYDVPAWRRSQDLSIIGPQFPLNLGKLFIMYLLTYSMEQSPSWEANWFCSSSRNSCILWNPNVQYSTHKRQPPVRILRQLHPVPTTPSSRSILILSSHLHLGLLNGLFPSPHQNLVHTSPFLHMCHMSCPSHSFRFYHLHNIGWGVQIIKLLIM